jgi:hypothetical protein
MAQHPGPGRDRRDRQSVFIHLLALCALLEQSLQPAFVIDLLGLMARGSPEFPALPRPENLGPLTILHLLGANDPTDYARRASEWAATVWAAWSAQHAVIRHALSEVLAPAGRPWSRSS